MARLPIFLRWSVIRMTLGMKKLLTDWQVGDGRERDVLGYILANSPRGDVDAAIAAIDRYAYEKKFLINVGDEKGAILDEVIERTRPARVVELGAYVGYSALRIARKLPAGGHLYSIEWNADNAAIASRIVEHAGVADRVTVVVGSIGDGGATIERLEREFGFRPGCLDVIFIDHDKNAYLPDLEQLLARGYFHAGSVAVADNVRFPGAPAYKAYMDAEEGKRWRTRAHRTHVEYQKLVPDVVLVSTFVG